MKVFIVLHDYSNMEKHYDEYCECFLDEIKAYQYALSLSNKDDEYGTFRVIEKDFSTEKSKEE